jgi:hypothetical protein
VHHSISQIKHQLDATLCRHSVSGLIRRCDDLPATISHVPVAAVLVLNNPDDGRLRPKHVEWLCRNKTCTVLHQVGVSFDLCSKVIIYVILKISKYIILLFRRKIYCRFTINRVVTLVLPLNSLHFILHMPHHPLHSHCRKLLFDLCRTKSLAKVKFQHKAVNFPAYIFTQRTSLVSA